MSCTKMSIYIYIYIYQKQDIYFLTSYIFRFFPNLRRLNFFFYSVLAIFSKFTHNYLQKIK